MQKFFILLVFIFLFATSCVPLTRFNELQDRNNQCDREREQYKINNEQLLVENTELKSRLEKLNKLTNQHKADSIVLSDSLTSLYQNYTTLNSRYTELSTSITNNTNDNKILLKKLNAAYDSLQRKEEKLRELGRNLNDQQDSLTLYETELRSHNIKLIELQKALNSKDSAVLTLKQKVATALLSYEKSGLTVKQLNGRVYVSLEEQLLFASGSTEVSANGLAALKKLAHVLEQNPDINITIEGHTDDVPVKAVAGMKDNWDLSVMRATSIIRNLLNGSKIDPARITASGRSEYAPVDAHKTADARKKNRRIEIILTPRLDEVFKILEN